MVPGPHLEYVHDQSVASGVIGCCSILNLPDIANGELWIFEIGKEVWTGVFDRTPAVRSKDRRVMTVKVLCRHIQVIRRVMDPNTPTF